MGPGWRLYCLKAVLAGGLLSAFLLSPQLWLSSRYYPLTPVSDRLPAIPSPLDCWWFGALLALLVALALLPRARWLVLLFLGLAALLSLWDQSRWQPWFYQYLAMLGAFGFCKQKDAGSSQTILNNARFIMAATYLWSGLQKCNVSFLDDTAPWLLEPFLPKAVREAVAPAGVVFPILETAIGVGLLVPVLRRIALVFVLVMHAGLLYCLGPLGHNWNTIVWPWNLAMMASAVLLFWPREGASFQATLWPGRYAYRWLVLVLFGIMPAFNFVGLWDSYLSASLYSGNVIDATISISPDVYAQLPPETQFFCTVNGERWEVDIMTWSMTELNVPPYPEPRIYRSIARTFCPLAESDADVILTILGRPHWRTGVCEHTFEFCSGLE